MNKKYTITRLKRQSEFKINYSSELNEQQYAAVTAEEGPALVIAGAGSGKTRTLTYRVAYLIENGVPSDNILLLTFTNKAADEMMTRVRRLINDELRGLWGGTFHSIGARILKRFANKLGYSTEFTILDRDDSEGLIKNCLNEMKIKSSAFPKPVVLSEIFSLAANTRKELDKLIISDYIELEKHLPLIIDLNQKYTKRKKENNSMDFDDLLVLWYRLLSSEPEVLKYYQQKFSFILVDEYQDTNKLQTDIIELLGALHRNIMVVGDDSQSIYSWRGANFKNILDFPKRFPDVKVYKIEYNYRSTPEILSFANEVISQNEFQFEKNLTATRDHGAKPMIILFDSVNTQAQFIADEIQELKNKGLNYSDMAVLYRSHFHSIELQLELTKNKIPHEVVSGIRFYEQAHIKDISSFLRLLINPFDEISFKRIVKMIPSIGTKSGEKLHQQFINQITKKMPNNSESTKEFNVNQPKIIKISESFKHCEVKDKILPYWNNIIKLFAEIESPDVFSKPDITIQTIANSFYKDYLAENYDNYKIRLDDIEQLASFASGFSSIDDFLIKLSLLTNLEHEESRTTGENIDSIRLSTVHQAKGLEFEAIFIIMVCEGFFPNERAAITIEGEEEERRLFYVAITRAKNLLYICCPQRRKNFGQRFFPPLEPSRFISSLTGDLYDGLKVTNDD